MSSQKGKNTRGVCNLRLRRRPHVGLDQSERWPPSREERYTWRLSSPYLLRRFGAAVDPEGNVEDQYTNHIMCLGRYVLADQPLTPAATEPLTPDTGSLLM